MNVPDDINHREIRGLVGNYVVDGYIQDKNTVYEFHGSFWHGDIRIYKPTDINPKNNKLFGELYEKTQVKKQAFIDAGFNYIEMWESDWEHRSDPTGETE